MSKNIISLLSLLRKEILSSWGKKCKEFYFGCSICWAHQTLENFESMCDDDWNIEPVKKKKK